MLFIANFQTSAPYNRVAPRNTKLSRSAQRGRAAAALKRDSTLTTSPSIFSSDHHHFVTVQSNPTSTYNTTPDTQPNTKTKRNKTKHDDEFPRSINKANRNRNSRSRRDVHHKPPSPPLPSHAHKLRVPTITTLVFSFAQLAVTAGGEV